MDYTDLSDNSCSQSADNPCEVQSPSDESGLLPLATQGSEPAAVPPNAVKDTTFVTPAPHFSNYYLHESSSAGPVASTSQKDTTQDLRDSAATAYGGEEVHADDIDYWLFQLTDGRPLAQLIATEPCDDFTKPSERCSRPKSDQSLNSASACYDDDSLMNASSSKTSSTVNSGSNSSSSNSASARDNFNKDDNKEKTTLLPPCRVCNKPASGFHYGVNSCEACKTFFRRTLLPDASMKPCKKKNDQCLKDSPNGKISCASCRYKKCIAVGMDREGCKKGRYTYAKRLNDLQEVQSLEAGRHSSTSSTATSRSSSDSGTNSGLVADSELHVLAYELKADFEKCFPDIATFYHQRKRFEDRIYQHFKVEANRCSVCGLISGENGQQTSASNSHNALVAQSFCVLHAQAAELSTVSSHFDISNIIDHLLAYIEKSLEQLVLSSSNFAKRIRGFNSLTIEDRMTLVKAAFTEFLTLVRWQLWKIDSDVIVRYDCQSDGIEHISGRLVRAVLDEEYWDFSMKCATKMQDLGLTLQDIALLTSVVLLSPDREGLMDSNRIEQLQEKQLAALKVVLKRNHSNKKDILPQCLLLLPALRECSVRHHRALVRNSQSLSLTTKLSAFMVEMLQINLSTPL